MLVEAVVAAFVATQLCYFVVNCGLLGLFLRRPTNVVDERTLGRVLERAAKQDERRPDDAADRARARADGGHRGTSHSGTHAGTTTATSVDTSTTGVNTETTAADAEANPHRTPAVEDGPGPRCRLPERYRRRIHVFVPVASDRWGALERTLASVARGTFPASAITVYPVFESPDSSSTDLEGTIDPRRPPGLEVDPIEVDPTKFGPTETDLGEADSEGAPYERPALAWTFEGPELSRSTAAAVADAYASRSVAADDVVTVLEAGTRVPVDALELAVAGLEEYDIVQAKRTVDDVDGGILPLLESMGAAIRSDLEAGSSAGPFHLPGTAAFLEASALEDLDRWRRETESALPLGVAASRRGYAFGVIDRYVRAPCPTRFGDWVREKRGWVRRLYRDLFARCVAGVDDRRRWAGTLLLQSLAVLTVVGLPAAALVALLSPSGLDGVAFSTPMRFLVGFNAVVWIYAVVRAYRAAWDAVPFRSGLHKLAYSVLANPGSQALYAMAWAVPIWLGLADVIRGRDESAVDPASR
ncbi:glycosyltransferase family 2 protein [Haloterrigena alkaliphila]|uniref:Glycosyltransferase 2-like domain-containing protein n=1 Tax=Haloterrigena alkaliphila TaxID=2816475 RepID=A0A8A2VN16_9EURY|nr:glycosyltransferase family 2 protein [Haloterrigena alkaliphila]QSW99528.1 glycosyltransferase family 2 protein [Haloterrigena alkaliphila]